MVCKSICKRREIKMSDDEKDKLKKAIENMKKIIESKG